MRLRSLPAISCLLLIPVALSRVQAGDPEVFPAFGIQVDVPRGWTRVAPTRSGHVAQWARLKDGGRRAENVVALEFVPLTEQLSTVAYAKSLAKEIQGEINQEVKLGGLPAVEVRAQRPSDNLTPRQVRVTASRGYLWILSFWAEGKGSFAMHTITSMADSVSWIPFASPSEHLALSPSSTALAVGPCKVRLPEIARPMPAENPATTVRFGIHDLERNNPEFQFQMQKHEVKSPADIASAKVAFVQTISETLPGLSSFEWSDLKNGVAQAARMAPVVLKPGTGYAPFREYHYALFLRGEDLFVVSFYLSTWKAEALSKYQAMIAEFLQTFEFPATPKGPAGTAPAESGPK
ncbi:MAG: hypothetical protein HYU36_22480 [Planctomycetes bacterium]|nr:hypothetical protein [Planctomycetota bacterium]